MTDKLVPFGKYKGQPVELLAQDRAYCDWLLNQEWFRTRNPDLVTIIINQSGEPTETPEHNALQVRFLDARFRLAFLHVLKDPFPELSVREIFRDVTASYTERRQVHTRLLKEQADWSSDRGWGTEEYRTQRLALVRTELAQVEAQMARLQWVTTTPLSAYLDHERGVWATRPSQPTFEVHGFDVCVAGQACETSYRYWIEAKPSLGDDYPAVLRQMKVAWGRVRASADFSYGLAARVLVVDHYAGVGATADQVAAIFLASDIRMVRVEEIDRQLTDLPI